MTKQDTPAEEPRSAKEAVEREPTISSGLDDELSASADSYISPARTGGARSDAEKEGDGDE